MLIFSIGALLQDKDEEIFEFNENDLIGFDENKAGLRQDLVRLRMAARFFFSPKYTHEIDVVHRHVAPID